MDYFVAKSGRYGERTAVDYRSRSSGGESARVAYRAANLGKQRVATYCRCRNWVLPAGSAGCCHEVGKCQYVAAIVFRVRHGIERGAGDVNNAFGSTSGVFGRSGSRVRGTPASESVELAGYTHFVKIGIAGKRQQTCLLSFPTEATNA